MQRDKIAFRKQLLKRNQLDLHFASRSFAEPTPASTHGICLLLLSSNAYAEEGIIWQRSR